MFIYNHTRYCSYTTHDDYLLQIYVSCREGFDEIGKKLKTEIDGCNKSSPSPSPSPSPSVSMGRRHVFGPAGSLNTITPCAACKLLRRRCAEECPFSPYFSPHEPHKFAAVHKVFGASNVSKMLMVRNSFFDNSFSSSCVHQWIHLNFVGGGRAPKSRRSKQSRLRSKREATRSSLWVHGCNFCAAAADPNSASGAQRGEG